MGVTMRVAGFIECSASDGPGIRSVLFVQGCSRRCLGCHNPKLLDASGGTEADVMDIVQYLLQKCRNRKLTISGGEPLEQPDALKVLLAQLKGHDFELCLYTGYRLEQVPAEIMEKLDYLKVGDFRQEEMYPPRPFVGSNNQSFRSVIRRKDGSIWAKEI